MGAIDHLRETTHTTVSVVIPAYNSRFLDETIASAYAQTVTPNEVIVVNDGSTDDTEDRLCALASQLPRGFVWRTKQNGGEASARNYGIRIATGTHVAFLDHDDLWHPEKLERQLDHFASDPDLSLSFTGYTYIYRGFSRAPGRTRPTETLRHEVWDTDPDVMLEQLLFDRCPIEPMSAVMVRRDALALVTPFDETLAIGSDVLMYLELAIRRMKIDYLPEVLVEYRWHGTNASRDVGLMWDNLAFVYDQFFHEHGRQLPDRIRARGPRWRAERHLTAAIDALRNRDKRGARRHIVAAARARPLSIRPGWVRMLGIGAPPRDN